MSILFPFTLTLFNMAGVRAGRVLLALYALKLGAQPFAVGVLNATFSALPMLLAWQAGKISDRFGTRWPLMFGAAGGACGLLVPYFLPGLPALYIAAAMNGFSFAFYSVSLQNLVGLMSEPHNRTVNFSNFSLTVSFATFLGPLLSGFAIDYSGHAVTCLYLVFLQLVPVLMLAVWGGALPRGTRTAPPAGGVRGMLTASGLWRVLATSSLLVTGIDLFQFYMPVYGHAIGLSASAIGVVLAMFSAAAFVVRLGLSRLIAWLGEEKMLACSFFLGAIGFMLVPFFKSAWVLSIVSFVFGLGMGGGQPITMMLTFSTSVEGRSGEVLGVRMTINHLTRVIGPVIFGTIGSAFGVFPVFWGNALMLACGAALSKSGKIVRKKGARP
jgi:MFS family permease